MNPNKISLKGLKIERVCAVIQELHGYTRVGNVEFEAVDVKNVKQFLADKLTELEKNVIHTKIERISDSKDQLVKATYGDVVKWSDVIKIFEE